MNRLLILASIIGFFALLVSLSRILETGWRSVMLFQIIMYVCVVAVAVLRKHLSYHFRSIVAVSVPLLLGIGGLITWGLVGFGIPSLFAFCVLATILYGTRAGIASTCLSVVVIFLVWLSVHTGRFVIDIDASVYIKSVTLWMSGISFTIGAAGLIGIALGGIHQQTAELIASLDKINSEQQETNERLRQEMAERIKGEKARHEMGVKLQKSEKMEFLGTLAGGVAHDLNNVLSGVTGYAEVLLLKNPGDERSGRYIRAIRESGKKAAAIVQDFLTLARRGVVVHEVVNLNEIVHQYVNSAEYDRLRQFHPHVTAELSLEEPLMNIIGSPVHMSKTIMNLVSNAAEAMPNGGRLIISTTNETLTEPGADIEEMAPGQYAVIAVQDTGTGISHDDIDKIFEPFYTKKVMGRSGTGLGMSVVWWTVKDHHGFINVKSCEGKGTTVKIYLPATNQKAAAKERHFFLEDYFGRGESVLVVDDVKDQRELAETIFNELGYKVSSLSGGEEAIAFMKDRHIDLVFMDMIMDPGIDGINTLKKILSFNPKQKAIITSGFSETEAIEEAEKMGCVKFIKKPYQLEVLARLVKRMLMED